jgi:hypothetical protein
MRRSGWDEHEGARCRELAAGVPDAEGDLSGGHVERLVPRVIVGGRAAAFGSGLVEDLKVARRRAIDEIVVQ